jgi:hypothetical protein
MNTIAMFLTVHWTAILAYLAIGTVLVRICDRVAEKFPKFAPYAAVVDALFHDLVELAAAVASVFGLKPPSAGNAAKAALVLVVALLSLPACTPSQLQQAATIADDVTKIAEVLCLADHARAANARALSVKDACATIEQLAPYIEQAKNSAPRASCAR